MASGNSTSKRGFASMNLEKQREIASKGGRSVPAKSLTTFTNGLLTLHGQNDQLRLLRPDHQRDALDSFAVLRKQLVRGCKK